jgi:hypothetical protein
MKKGNGGALGLMPGNAQLQAESKSAEEVRPLLAKSVMLAGLGV